MKKSNRIFLFHHFSRINDASFQYQLLKKLGHGAFGQVYYASKTGETESDSQHVVIKIIKINRVKMEQNVPSEVYYLKKVEHLENVIHLLDYFTDSLHLYMIFPEIKDHTMDLFTYTELKMNTLPEKVVKHIFRQCVKVILDLSRLRILHGDIKDENYLIKTLSKQIILIDFGAATEIKTEPYETFGGTEIYSPPEWIAHQSYYSDGLNVWSLGEPSNLGVSKCG